MGRAANHFTEKSGKVELMNPMRIVGMFALGTGLSWLVLTGLKKTGLGTLGKAMVYSGVVTGLAVGANFMGVGKENSDLIPPVLPKEQDKSPMRYQAFPQDWGIRKEGKVIVSEGPSPWEAARDASRRAMDMVNQ